MAGDPESLSKRARALAAARARREATAALRQASFDALAAGWSIRHIAEARKVSVKTVSREIERAVAERQLDAPGRFVHLQVARLTKALRLADLRIERGELAAIAPPALERCHGRQDQSEPARPAPHAAPPLPAPPLALAHAAPPLDDNAEQTLEGTEGTVFGAPKGLKSLARGQTCTGWRMANCGTTNGEWRNSEWALLATHPTLEGTVFGAQWIEIIRVRTNLHRLARRTANSE